MNSIGSIIPIPPSTVNIGNTPIFIPQSYGVFQPAPVSVVHQVDTAITIAGYNGLYQGFIIQTNVNPTQEVHFRPDANATSSGALILNNNIAGPIYTFMVQFTALHIYLPGTVDIGVNFGLGITLWFLR